MWTPELFNGPEAEPPAALMLSMLRYASDQGSAFATIGFVGAELRLKGPVGGRPATFPQEIRARLDAINSTNRYPDGLVMAAKIAEHDGDDPLADSLAARATRLRDEDPSLFFRYPQEAFILRGYIRRRAGDAEGAESFFREAARRYGSRKAALELLYDGECPEAVQELTGLAVRSHRYHTMDVSQGESEFAVKMLERGEKQRFLDHQYIAQEWLKLARTKDEDLRNE